MENSLSRYRAADKIAVRKFFRYRKGAMRGAFSETPFIYSILCRSKEIVSDRKCTLSVLWEGTHPVVLSHIRILFRIQTIIRNRRYSWKMRERMPEKPSDFLPKGSITSETARRRAGNKRKLSAVYISRTGAEQLRGWVKNGGAVY